MKGGIDPMKNHEAPNPCEESTREVLARLLPEKDFIGELDVLSFDKHHATFVFNGSLHMANSTLYVGDNIVAEYLPLFGECNNAISSTNKRLLQEHDIFTDYVDPNPLLARALGFSEEEAKLIVYAIDFEPMPIKIKVVGYDKASGAKLETAKVVAFLDTDSCEALTDEEAITVIADYLLDTDRCISSFELIEEFESIDKLLEVTELSPKAKAFGESGNEDDIWEQMEFALAYELAADYYRSMVYIALQAYAVLHDKYAESDFILAETEISIGVDDDDIFCICGEVGTMNNSLIVNKADFVETGKFVQTHLKPLMVYYDEHGEDAEVTDEVLDEVADTAFYVAEGLCGDMEFDVYIN